MERVKKGEKYWYVDYYGDTSYAYEHESMFDYMLFEVGNYFHTKEEAEAMAKKLRAVLKGAGVIEIPSNKEIQAAEEYYMDSPYDPDETVNISDCCNAFWGGVEWLKSKIIK